jgi:hypothetical protein
MNEAANKVIIISVICDIGWLSSMPLIIVLGINIIISDNNISNGGPGIKVNK